MVHMVHIAMQSRLGRGEGHCGGYCSAAVMVDFQAHIAVTAGGLHGSSLSLYASPCCMQRADLGSAAGVWRFDMSAAPIRCEATCTPRL